eukprot:TRINITY_DN7165_c0_g1_i2.p1 TRINITY_DN7165_c0_g1~~TRINITY_DN7165_c0_g1_i2.p1  ORF type:complete len:1312 (+),score=176.26 TRINITY_DN7165_c0_g1_i2:529-3936(+)
MQGVTTFTSPAVGNHRIESGLRSGAGRIASWADGVPLIAEKFTASGGRILGINLIPTEAYAYQPPPYKLIANALQWCGLSNATLATKIAFAQEPGAQQTVLVPFGVVVEFRTNSSAPVPVPAGSTILLTLVGGTAGAVLGGTTGQSTVANKLQYVFNVTVDRLGTGYTLVATSGSLTATSAAFNLLSSNQFVIRQSPVGDNVAGSAIAPALVVEITNAAGTVQSLASGLSVTVSIANDPSGAATLSGTRSITSDGTTTRFTFSSLAIDKVGQGYTLRVSVSDSSLAPVTSTAFNIVLGAPSQLVVITQPATTQVSLVPFPTVVEVRDSAGNPVGLAGATLTVSLRNVTNGATLFGTLSQATNASASRYLFSALAVDKAAKNYQLTFQTSSGLSASSTAFDVIGGSPNALVITSQPPTAVNAGDPFSIVVGVRDSAGNPATSSGGTLRVYLSTNPTSATLQGTLTAVLGTTETDKQFSALAVRTVGSGYVLTAELVGCCTAITTSFAVTSAAAVSLAFVTQPPAQVTAGQAFTAEVAAIDSFGNRVSGGTGSCSLALLGCDTCVLSGTTSITASSSASSFIFNTLKLNKTGTGYSLRATFGQLTATSSTFVVVANSAAKLVVIGHPASPQTAAKAFTMTVQTQDAYGNPAVVADGKTITISLGNDPTGGKASLTGSLTDVSKSDVTFIFNYLLIDKVGVGYTLVATLTPDGWSDTSKTFDIIAGPAAQLAFTVGPQTTVTANQAFSVQVEVQDSGGNAVVPPSDATIVISIYSRPDSTAILGGGTAQAATSATRYTFDTLTLDKKGVGYILQASAPNKSWRPAVSFPFDVVFACSTGLTECSNKCYNLTSDFNNCGQCAKVCNSGQVCLASLCSSPPATQLRFVVQPAPDVLLSRQFSVTVAITDIYGNSVSNHGLGNRNITIGFAADPTVGRVTMSGTNYAVTSDGQAQYSFSLALDVAAYGYVLQAALSGTSWKTTSSAFNVITASTVPIAPPSPVVVSTPVDNSNLSSSDLLIVVLACLLAILCCALLLFATLWWRRMSGKKLREQRPVELVPASPLAPLPPIAPQPVPVAHNPPQPDFTAAHFELGKATMMMETYGGETMYSGPHSAYSSPAGIHPADIAFQLQGKPHYEAI